MPHQPIAAAMPPAWPVYAGRAVLALAIAALVVPWPGPTLLGLVGFCAAYGLIAGLMGVSAALAFEPGRYRWLFLSLGLGTLCAGGLAALYPGWAALGLALVIGLNALVSGLLDLPEVLRTHDTPSGRWASLRAGTAIVFGVLLLTWPGAGLLVMVWALGCYAAVIGALNVALAVRAHARRAAGMADDAN